MNILLLHFYNHYTKNKHLNSFKSSEIKILKMKTKNTTLLEQFQNQISNRRKRQNSYP